MSMRTARFLGRSPFAAALLLLTISNVSTQALAASATNISTVGASHSTEPCLEGGLPGDPGGTLEGRCAGPRNDSDFSGRKSILSLIRDDIAAIDGAAAGGEFVRVDDEDDQIWQVLNGHHHMKVRVRSRYQGADYIFGTLHIDESNRFTALIAGQDSAVKSKVLLSSCADADLKFASGVGRDRERCAEFGDHKSTAAFKEMPLVAGDRIALAIASSERFAGGIGTAVAKAGYGIDLESVTLPTSHFFTSRDSLNVDGVNQMVTFRYSKEVRYEDGAQAVTVYIVAFMDQVNNNGINTGFNDYVVEITLAEPIAGER